MFFANLIESFLLPPMLFLFLALIGLGISLMWKKLGVMVAGVSILILFLLSLPVTASFLMQGLQAESALEEQNISKALKNVDALVVLGGGRRFNTTEFGKDTASALTLERLRYAAWIAKRTGLPLIVSGGKRANENQAEAELMQEILQKEFVVIVDHLESISRNTYENAKYTSEILTDNKMKSIVLVTHAWHMPRAKKAFEYFDLKVVPAPTAFYGLAPSLATSDFMPSAQALYYTSLAFHEIIGELWYEFRYY